MSERTTESSKTPALKRGDIIDIAWASSLALLFFLYLSTENVLQEIEVMVGGCLATLIYIALQIRTRS